MVLKGRLIMRFALLWHCIPLWISQYISLQWRLTDHTGFAWTQICSQMVMFVWACWTLGMAKGMNRGTFLLEKHFSKQEIIGRIIVKMYSYCPAKQCCSCFAAAKEFWRFCDVTFSWAGTRHVKYLEGLHEWYGENWFCFLKKGHLLRLNAKDQAYSRR